MRVIVTLIVIFWAMRPVSAFDYFALKADSVGSGIEILTQLSSLHGDCEGEARFASMVLVKAGKPGHIPHSLGCWTLMPHGRIVIFWENLATGAKSNQHLATTDFYTGKEPELWWQFTPGLRDLPKEEPETATPPSWPAPVEGAFGHFFGSDPTNGNSVTISLMTVSPDNWCDWGRLALLEGHSPSFTMRRCWAPEVDGGIYLSGPEREGENSLPITALKKADGFDTFIEENFGSD